AQVAIAPKRREIKKLSSRPGLKPRILIRNGIVRTGGAQVVQPRRESGMISISITEEIERDAAAECRDSRDLPTFENLPDHTFLDERPATTDRDLPNIVQCQALSDVKIRGAAFGMEVKRISREAAVAKGRINRVSRIVDGVRPGV